MYCLNDTQIDFILNDISARGVEMESLQQNLLDHICCIIEQNLEADGDFESFYQKTTKTFYKDALWEIEEETLLLLTFKNYYSMKKTMIISGMFSASAMILGIIFKFMHWPGASALIILGIVASSLIFLPLFFLLKAKEKTKSTDKLILGLGTLSGILMSLSILFRVMHWPFGFNLGIISIVVLGLVFLPIYFFNGIRNPELKINTIATSIVIIMICGLQLTLVNSRPNLTIEKTSIRLNQHLNTTYDYATQQNEINYDLLLKDSVSNKTNLNALRKTCNELCTKIEALKITLFQQTEDDSTITLNYYTLQRGNNYDIPTSILFDENANPKKNILELREQLNSFNTYIMASFNQNSSVLINLADAENLNTQQKETWEKLNFYHVPLASILRNLTQLQLEIRLVESNCM